jgi:outer membrane immunogenic protein
MRIRIEDVGQRRRRSVPWSVTSLLFRLQHIVLAAFALSVGAGAADAACIGPSCATDVRPALWSGTYAGFNIGYGWQGDRNADLVVLDQYGNPYATGPLPHDLGGDGVIGGGQIGYNVQMNGLVIGLEADLQGSAAGGDRTTHFPAGGVVAFDYSTTREVEWFATLRGRLGYAFDRTLVYVTGGLALGEVHYDAHYAYSNPALTGGATFSRRDLGLGYAIGAGIEQAFGANWSVKLEYQFIDLGSSAPSGGL